MKKNSIQKLIDKPTNVYTLVDQDFLLQFNSGQRVFMLYTYYDYYKKFCEKNNYQILPIDSFLKNSRRKKIKVVQYCCPYCGRIAIHVSDKSVKEIESLKYCGYCGKRSTTECVFE